MVRYKFYNTKTLSSSSDWAYPYQGYLKEQRYFNNVTHDQLHSSDTLGIHGLRFPFPSLVAKRDPNSWQCFHSAWASSGGIVGRGILLDYCSWVSQNSVPLTPLTSTAIPFSHLQRVIVDQKVSFRPGDILFVRSGFGAAYNALSPSERLALSKRPSADFIGVEPTKEILQWLWENQFAAVAGDAPAFERSPVGWWKDKDDVPSPVVLHQWLLGGWGMPIGEMFDLESLAEHCRESGRWSFFLSSVPLKARRAQWFTSLAEELFQHCARIWLGDRYPVAWRVRRTQSQFSREDISLRALGWTYAVLIWLTHTAYDGRLDICVIAIDLSIDWLI